MFVRRSEKILAVRKSRAKIKKSAQKVGMVLVLLIMIFGYGKIKGTNSFFKDTATSSGNSFSAAVWIPTLTYTVEPAGPNGQNGWYTSKPCVKLFSDIDNVTIHYEFTGDNPESGTVAEDTCVDAPEGVNHFSAYAENNENPSWISSTVGQDFKVDTKCPVVKITNPEADEELNGNVEISGKVTDENPDHYWLVIEDSGGHQAAGPGTVNDTNNFDGKFFDWDTTKVPDGDYKIKLEARDVAGNKCPNQAPVLSDPNNPNDSVDWIDIKVDNNMAELRDVVINEVMWMGSADIGDPSYDGPKDQWVELKNVSDKNLHIKDWYLTYNSDAGNENKLATVKDDRVIKPGEYYLFTYYTKNNSAINVDPDNSDMNNFDYEKFQLNLYDDKGSLIDTAGDKSGEPEKGDKTNFYSMERNNSPGDGTKYSNWHSCEDPASSKYWDSGRSELGTPGADNLSGEGDLKTTDTAALVSKKVNIDLKGKLDVPDGFEADVSQKIKKIELSGDESVINDLGDLEIDLAKIKIEKAGKIEITVLDLNLPKDVDSTSAKNDDVAVLITVTEKPKDDAKKDETIQSDSSAILNTKSDTPADEVQDDSGDGGATS